jgi:hypothetical protein
MTRTMYDATHQLVPNIPRAAQLVAGYLPPSPYAWTAADWAAFPNAVHVRIAVRAATNDGHVLDVETGDATPAEAPGWVRMRRAGGADPTVYCSASLWPTVQQQFVQQGVAQPHYWIASYPGGGPVIPSGAVAHQWQSTTNYDISVVADYWPGVDTPGGDVNLTDSIGTNTSGQNVVVVDVLRLMYSALADSKAAPRGQTLYDSIWANGAALGALAGALSTDEAAILAAIAGADSDVKADVAQLAAAVAALPAGQPPTDAQMAALTAAVTRALPGYTVNITPTGGTA